MWGVGFGAWWLPGTKVQGAGCEVLDCADDEVDSLFDDAWVVRLFRWSAGEERQWAVGRRFGVFTAD